MTLLPQHLLERCMCDLDAASVAYSSAVSSDWRRAAAEDGPWVLALASCAVEPYSTSVTGIGITAWLASALGGNIKASRQHLHKLQASRRLAPLYRVVRCFHNGVELELQAAKRAQMWYNNALAKALVTVEILNFWSHDCWVLLRPSLPSHDAHEDAEEERFSDSGAPQELLDLSGLSATVRCWAAESPDQFVYILQCGSSQIFHVPALSTVEIGRHWLTGHAAKDGALHVDYAMGRWCGSLPLPLSSADSVLGETSGNTEILLDPDNSGSEADAEIPEALQALGIDGWLEGRQLEDHTVLSPTLFAGTVRLDLTPYL